MALTSPPVHSTKQKVSKAVVAGASTASVVLLAAIIAFIIWRTRRNNRTRENPVAASVFNEHSSNIGERKTRDTYVLQHQSTPSSRPYSVGERIPASPSTDRSSYSNPMIVPTPIFRPEIQSEGYPRHGSLPITQTTTLAPLEKRTMMARQGPDATSNTNTGFYSSVVSASINANPSSNQLYDTTRVPLNHGISATMNMHPSSNRLYDVAKSPLRQGSSKGG